MPGIEDELQIERSKTVARWIGILVLAGLIEWQRATGVIVMPGRELIALTGVALAINVAHSVYLYRTAACPLWYKYVSVSLDLLVISVCIHYTRYNQSPFFYVYFLILISNCIRYGLFMSLYIALLVNVLYAVTLSRAPAPLAPTVLGGEGLKILAFWGVAFYGGAVAAHMRRQAWEIAALEETIAQLRAGARTDVSERDAEPLDG